MLKSLQMSFRWGRSAGGVLLPIVLCGISVAIGLSYISPTVDTLCRYAPMAEAVASGNWFEAFHPRFGVGFPLLAGGIVWLTGLDGNSACVALAMIGWALTAVPLFRLMREVAGVRAAWFAVALLLACPQPLFWGFQGLRETWRMAATVAAVASLFELKSHPRAAMIEVILAQVVFLSFRCDTFLYALLTGVAFLVVDRAGRRTALVAVVNVAATIPNFVLMHTWTGWWLPSPHFIPLVSKWVGIS